ncbi:hypothetical protein GA565_05050 [Rouxiella sp. S1S-2]|nr:hypothetical protein [Rouxiella sp. S1S-2]KAB7895404.1 hypothetical protein GA565_05050 [Rouxiella sp. S1S-2]
MTLRYRGYRTEVILKELGLDPEDATRERRPRNELIAQLVAMKLSSAHVSNSPTCSVLSALSSSAIT